MILAVASGQGGTGKTTVAANLALSLASKQEGPSTAGSIGEDSCPLLLGCDVEEPNAALLASRPSRNDARLGR